MWFTDLPFSSVRGLDTREILPFHVANRETTVLQTVDRFSHYPDPTFFSCNSPVVPPSGGFSEVRSKITSNRKYNDVRALFRTLIPPPFRHFKIMGPFDYKKIEDRSHESTFKRSWRTLIETTSNHDTRITILRLLASMENKTINFLALTRNLNLCLEQWFPTSDVRTPGDTLLLITISNSGKHQKKGVKIKTKL